MSNLTDDKGHNQVFRPSKAMSLRTERRCDYMIKQMNFDKDSNFSDRRITNILEIGCGTGEIAHLLAKKTNADVVGTDICIPFIEEAKSKYELPNLEFRILDFNDPASILENKFDYIIGNGILHHLYNNLNVALLNIKSLLVPQGKIIFLEPNLYNPYCYLIFNTTKGMRKWAKLEPDEMALRKRKIKKQLMNANYTNIEIKYKDFLLPNTPNALIAPVCFVGNVVEKIPIINMFSQSIFISAQNK